MAKREWCPRYSWYLIKGQVPDRKEEVSHWLANVFTEGHSIHAKYQKWFKDMGILEGTWLCDDCKYEWWDRSPEICTSCRSEHLSYIEVEMEIPDLFSVGHADGIVWVDDKRVAIEIKSVSLRSVEIETPTLYAKYADGTLDLPGLFRAIRMPFGSHLKQGQIYLHGLRQNEATSDIDTMVFIYEFKANQEVRAWSVKYNADVIKPLLPGARAVQTAVREGKRVKHPIWADPEHIVCKSCMFLPTCEP